jgi:hypothetical protein
MPHIPDPIWGSPFPYHDGTWGINGTLWHDLPLTHLFGVTLVLTLGGRCFQSRANMDDDLLAHRYPECDERVLPEKGGFTPRPQEYGLIQRLWRRFQARFRINLRVVCEESRGRGLHDDYHDYPDDIHGQPMHFAALTCKRCRKEFFI